MKRSELRPDPDKVREFITRNRKPLRRGTPLRQRKPAKRRARVPVAVLRAICAHTDGKCVVCGTRRVKPSRDRHHVLPVQRWPQFELEPRNQVLACLDCHMNHEAAARRIRWAELPPGVRAWVAGADPRAATFLARTYPQ